MEGILPAQNCDGPCLSSMGRGALGGAYRIAAPMNNPGVIGLWYGSQLGGFGLTYAAPYVPPTIALVRAAAFTCVFSDTCRDNVSDLVLGLVPGDDGKMPTTRVGWAFFVYNRIQEGMHE